MSAFPPVMPVYQRPDLAFVRGEGAWMWDTEGRRFLDFCAGIAVNLLGHGHPHLVKALTDQAQKLWHCSNLFRVEGQEVLARRLVEATFADTVFFTNSGAEAWECGLKLVRRHFHVRGEPHKNRLITVAGAFHGRTMAGISAAGSDKMVNGFAPLLDGFDQVAFGNLNELRAAIGPNTAAIHFEPILGEGGIRVGTVEYLREVRRICDEFGLLLYLDEVQCGMGRTGKLFAHEHAGITPDVMCIAKGIGGGFPLGACLATAAAADGMTAGTHGSTYGGNPLAMAVGNAVLDVVLAPGFLGRVTEVGDLLRARLESLVRRLPDVYVEVRGQGLMLGLRLADGLESRPFVAKLREQFLLTVPASDNVIRLLPPLTIGETEIDEAIRRLEAAALDRPAQGLAA